ncbi:error-prone repair protein UmuD [Aquitalea magnusonii]|uniref:Error-prone repair protein UmuD n=1 Tax=Aquitalea magnusonii TaxID=332411 RepID=A0A3G9GJ84_9NEIS|nr:S24 family peptidase [Aquitalea magnusonii]BBF85456.1 error-prone repair protein UmuD [Aquitalea magnusonii]
MPAFSHDTNTSRFTLRMPDHALSGAGIAAGHWLHIDSQASPVHGSLVLAALDGELLVRRLQRSGKHLRLLAAHPDYPDIDPHYGQDFAIWGVASSCAC